MKRSIGQKIRSIIGVRLGVFDQFNPQPMKSDKFQHSQTVIIDPPKFSLVTPSYNQGNFIERTVNSVLAQEYPELDYLVQDGSSTDNTATLLKSFNDRIRVSSKPDKGQADAINLGFAKTNNSIMGWLNSDDILLPDTLWKVANIFRNNPEVDVVYGNRLIIDETDNVIGAWVLPDHDEEVLRLVNYVPQETLFWRRSAWERAGGFVDINYAFAMDWEFILRLIDTGSKFMHVPMFLGAFRWHQAQKTSTVISTTGRYEMELLREKYGQRNFILNNLAHFQFLCRHKKAHKRSCL